MPSTAKLKGPKAGSTLKIQSTLWIAWNCPSPSKEAHKRIVTVNVNNDHSNPIFHKRTIFSLGVIKRKNEPIKGNININSNIYSKFDHFREMGLEPIAFYSQSRQSTNWYTPCESQTKFRILHPELLKSK